MRTSLRQRAAIGSNHSAALARVWENTAKVALIKAVGANPAAPVIRADDAIWARDVVAHCVATLEVQTERHLADNDTERNHKRVLEIIRRPGPAGMTRSELLRSTQFLEKRQLEDILSRLVEGTMITAEEVRTRTKPALRYRAVAAAQP
jgi:hypothetical protein